MNMKAVTERYVKQGWQVVSVSEDMAVVSRKKSMNVIVLVAGVIGLFFYLIPGLLILLIGYAARGTETKVLDQSNVKNLERMVREETERKEARALRRVNRTGLIGAFGRLNPILQAVVGAVVIVVSLVLFGVTMQLLGV